MATLGSKPTIKVKVSPTGGLAPTSSPVTLKNVIAPNRIDKLIDVDASGEANGATLVYQSNTDSYVVRRLQNGEIEGGLDVSANATSVDVLSYRPSTNTYTNKPILGTNNEVTVVANNDVIVVGLPDNVTITNNLIVGVSANVVGTLAVGSNVVANTTTIAVGNSTVNTTVNSTALYTSTNTGGPGTGIMLNQMNMFAFANTGGNAGNPTFRNAQANTQTVLRVLPNGSVNSDQYTTQTQFEFFAVDYYSNTTNWHNLRLLAQNDRFVIDTARGANTDPARPIVFDIGGTGSSNATNANYPAVLALSASGKVGVSTADPDATLTVNGTINVSSDMWIGGNLTVTGTTTYINTTQVNIGDNIIALNTDITGVPFQDVGFEVNRGTSANVSFLWNEANARWTLGNTYITGPSVSLLVGNTSQYTTITGNTITTTTLNLSNVVVSSTLTSNQITITGATGNGATIINDTGISSWNYTGKSFSIAGQETAGTGIHFKPDGTKMYIVGQTGDAVFEYNLGTAWDISTLAYSQSFSILAQDTSTSDLFFSPDGLKMYVLGDTVNGVLEYTLGTAWNVTTATYTQQFSTSSQETGPNGLYFKSDGTTFWVVGSGSDAVFEYTLSTPWNVSTATYSTRSFSVATQESTATALSFSDDGLQMFVGGTTTDRIYQYTLSTPWNVTTATFVGSVTVAMLNANINGLYYNATNGRVWITDSTADAVFELTTNIPGLKINANTVAFSNTVRVANVLHVAANAYFQGGVVVYGTTTLGTTTLGTVTSGSITVTNTVVSTSYISTGNSVQNSAFSNILGGISTAVPGTPTTATATTGGTLAAATYYYRITGLDANGNESLGSTEVSRATTGTTSTVTLTFAPLPGAWSYRVYRSTTSGTYTAGYIAVPLTSLTFSGANYVYVDTGTALTVATLPTTTNARLFYANNTSAAPGWFGAIYNKPSSNVGILTNTPDATLAVSGTANISGNVVIGGSTGTSTIITGNSTVNAVHAPTYLQVANSTATSNLTPLSLNIGANVIANSTALFTGNSTANAIHTQGFVSVSNSTVTSNLQPGAVNVGANTIVNTTTIFLGNSTVNAVETSTYLQIANSTTTANLTPGLLSIGNSTVNATHSTSVIQVANSTITSNLQLGSLNIGANASVNTTAVYIGNSTANAVHAQGFIQVANSTVTSNLAVGSLNIGANVIANTTAVYTGNSTANAVHAQGYVSVSNSTITSNITPGSVSVGANVIANATNILIGNSSVYNLANSTTTVFGSDSNSGIGFFQSFANYFISMKAIGATQAGRLDATSDYNMYFQMNGGTNRGFVFRTGSNPVAQIDASGNIYANGSIYVGNSSVNTTINPSGISTVGTLSIGNTTINGTLGSGNTTITGWANVSGNVTATNIRTTGGVQIDGDLTVSGNTITIGVTNLNVTDNMIYLNEAESATVTSVTSNGTAYIYTANNTFSAGMVVTVTGVNPSGYNVTANTIVVANATHFTVANTSAPGAYVSGGSASGKSAVNPDLGFSGGYDDGTYRHAGFFRDATDGVFKVFDQYVPEPSGAFIDTSNNTFRIADFQSNNSVFGTANVAGTTRLGVGQANYLQLVGNSTTNAPNITAQGTDTDIGVVLSSKGAGRFGFFTNNLSNEQFRIAHTTSAVNYLQATGAATGGAPYFLAAGADANVGITFTTKGTGSHQFWSNGGTALQFAVTHTASAVNYLNVSGGAAGSGAYLAAVGNDTNVSMDVRTKGTGSFEVSTGGVYAPQFRVAHTASAVNYVSVTGAATGLHPSISATGTDTDVRLNIFSKGAASVDILTAGGGTRQARFVHVTSAVNYVQIQGAVTGSGATITSQGTDANVDIIVNAKGDSSARLRVSDVTKLQVSNTTVSVTGNTSLSLGAFNGEGGELGFANSTGGSGPIVDVDGGNDWRFNTYNNASNYKFNTGASPTTAVMIAANSFVGFGTTAPAYKIDVYTNSNTVSSAVRAVNANTDVTASAQLIATQGSTSFAQYVLGGTAYFGTTTNSSWYLVSNNTIKGILAANGNFGIGNTTPTDKLRVEGTLSHTGLSMSTGTNVDQIYTATPSITLSTAWQSTGVTSTNLANGTYIVQLFANDVAAGGTANNEYYSGMMSWYSADTNSTVLDEIPLHRTGINGSNNAIFLATQRTATANTSDLILMIASSANNSSASTYTIKLRRMI